MFSLVTQYRGILAWTVPFIAAVFFFVAQPVFAQGEYGPQIPKNLDGADINLGVVANKSGITPDENVNGVEAVVARVIRTALSMVGLLFLGRTILAGFRWMNAAGNSDEVTKAKTTVQHSVTGLVLVMSAAAITELVLSIAS